MFRVVNFFAVLLWLSVTAVRAEPQVVVTVKPIHSLVAAVMTGIGEPYLMVKGAATPHAYAMKPSDASALQKADVVFRVGGSFENFLNAAIKSGNSSAEIVSLGQLDGMRRLKFREGAAWGGHGDAGHSHDHKEGHDDEFDPHIWLNPDNAIVMVGAIAKTLGLLDSRRLLEYARNAAAVTARIKDMQAEIRTTLTPVQGRPFMVFHDAYQYFEKAFDVTAVGAVSLGETRAPGAKRIRSLKRQIAKRKVVCLFSEPQFEPKIVSLLIQGTKVRSGVLDPIGAEIDAGGLAYFKLMYGNAKALADCLK